MAIEEFDNNTNPFEGEEPEETSAEQTEETAEDSELNDFIGETEEAGFVPDPDQVVTIRTSGGDNRYVPVDGPKSLSQVMLSSGLRFEGEYTVFLNGVQIQGADIVPAGSTLNIIGSVKGGSR